MLALRAGLAGLAAAGIFLFSDARIASTAREQAEQGLVYWQSAETRHLYSSLSANELLATSALAAISLATIFAGGAPQRQRKSKAIKIKRQRARQQSWPQHLQILDVKTHQTARALADAVWQGYCADAAGLKHVANMPIPNVTARPDETLVLQLHSWPKGLLICHGIRRNPHDKSLDNMLWATTHINARDFRAAQGAHAYRHIFDADYATTPLLIRARLTKARYARPHFALGNLPRRVKEAISAIRQSRTVKTNWQHLGISEKLAAITAQAKAEQRWFKNPRLPAMHRLLALKATRLDQQSPDGLSPKTRQLATKILGKGWLIRASELVAA